MENIIAEWQRIDWSDLLPIFHPSNKGRNQSSNEYINSNDEHFELELETDGKPKQYMQQHTTPIINLAAALWTSCSFWILLRQPQTECMVVVQAGCEQGIGNSGHICFVKLGTSQR